MNTRALNTVEQAAEKLGLAEATVRAWMAQRRIEYIKLGRAVRVPESEIERLIAAGTVPSREQSQ
jgi:excisionase family DNA binding protein